MAVLSYFIILLFAPARLLIDLLISPSQEEKAIESPEVAPAPEEVKTEEVQETPQVLHYFF